MWASPSKIKSLLILPLLRTPFLLQGEEGGKTGGGIFF